MSMLTARQDIECALQNQNVGPVVDLDEMPEGDLKKLFVRVLGDAFIRVQVNSRRSRSSDWRDTFVWICMDSRRSARSITTKVYRHILVYDGLVAQLVHDAYRIAHDPDVFPWFGSLEGLARMRISRLDVSAIRPESLLENLGQYAVPDEQRQRLALMLLSLSFLFVIDHEYCHLANHHAFLSSPETAPPSIVDFLTLQALEMDADTYAFNRWADILFAKDPILERDEFSDLASTLREKNRTATYALFIYAIFCAFRGLGQQDWTATFPSTSPHPPAPFRFKTTLTALWERLKQSGSDSDLNDYNGLLKVVWPLLEFLYTRESTRPPILLSLDDVNSPEATRHFHAVYEVWRRLVISRTISGWDGVEPPPIDEV